MNQALEKRRDELAISYRRCLFELNRDCDSAADFAEGFDSACEILLPLIEEMKTLLNTADNELQLNGYFDASKVIEFKDKIESVIGEK